MNKIVRFGESRMYTPKFVGKRLNIAQIILRQFESLRTDSSHLHFMRIVKKLAKKTEFNHVFDAGCGYGTFSFWLAREYQNIMIDACDFSEERIGHCKETKSHLGTRNINFYVQDLRTYKSDSTYDFIFSNHVLEHIIENRLVISNLVSSLKKGGYIYIQIPNAVEKRTSNFVRKFLKGAEEWVKKEHIGQTLTLDLLSSELERSGCKILIARHIDGIWGKLHYELSMIALSYLHRFTLYALLFPVLAILGYVDTLSNYSEGNGILVLAKKSSGEKYKNTSAS